MTLYRTLRFVLLAALCNGCSVLGCYQEKYLFEGFEAATGYLSDVSTPEAIEHRQTMIELGEQVFDSKEALVNAGYEISSCGVTPDNVHYCFGMRDIQEVRIRQVCPRYGSRCRDGTYSPSKGRGTCSHHGGVAH